MRRVSILFGMLGLILAVVTAVWADVPYQGDGYAMLNAEDLEWGPIDSMPPGAQIAIIEGDLSQEVPFTIRLKLPADYRIAPHTHPAYERVTVLTGTLYFGHGKEFNPDNTMALETGGMALMAPGEPMFGYTTEEEAVIQLHGTGPWGIEYIDPADDPRK